MFRIKLANGYEFDTDSVQEGLIQKDENRRAAIMLSFSNDDDEDPSLEELSTKLSEGISKIEVYGNESATLITV